MLEEVEKRSIPSLEVTHAHKRLALREKQLNELAGSMKDLINKEELVKQYAEQAEKASEAAEEFRKRAMFDMANKIEQIKNERQLQSEEQRIAMEEEVRQLELQLEDEREEEVLREAEKEAERFVDIKRKRQARKDAEKVWFYVYIHVQLCACFYIICKYAAVHNCSQYSLLILSIFLKLTSTVATLPPPPPPSPPPPPPPPPTPSTLLIFTSTLSNLTPLHG